MKSTGIVRRIDELGRIVVPKEIRKNLRIGTADNIEIYVENESIILKKFSLIKTLNDVATTLVDSITSVIKKNVIITDTSNIISCSTNLKKEILNKNISEYLENSIQRRENFIEKHKKELKITEKYSLDCTYIIKSIINNGDVVGLFIILDENDNVNDIDILIADLSIQFLNKYLEK